MSKCPYCNEPVTLNADKSDKKNEVTMEIKARVFIKQQIMYSCPHCDKVLGFAFYIGLHL